MGKKTLLLALALALPGTTMASYHGGAEHRATTRHAPSRAMSEDERHEKDERVHKQIERRQARKIKQAMWEE